MNDEAIGDEAESLLQFVYQFPVAVLRMSGAGEIDLMNPRAVALLAGLGLPHQPDQGWLILEALDPSLCVLVRAHLLDPGPVSEQRPVRRTDPQGREHHLSLTAIVVNVNSCMLAIEDVTSRVLQERQLERERRSLAIVLEALQGYFVLMLDLELRITQSNPSIQRLFGQGASIVGRACGELLRSESSASVDLAEKAELAVRSGWSSFEAEYRCANGSVIWGDTMLTTIVDEAGNPSGFVIVARDVSERRRREDALIDEALTDPLTGLLNRRGLAARVAPWLEQTNANKTQTISALALDIDHFKRVNDHYGHDGGDAVLRHLGALLTKQFRRNDIVARLGGEEFVVLLRDAPLANAMALAERVRHLLEHSPAIWQDTTISVTTSIGVATGANLTGVEQLLHDADQALYRAKHEGRNRVVCF